MKIKANVAVFMKKIIRRFDWVQVWVIQKEVFVVQLNLPPITYFTV
jgi:hypothetical protein